MQAGLAYIYVNELKTMTIKLATGQSMPSAIEINTPTEMLEEEFKNLEKIIYFSNIWRSTDKEKIRCFSSFYIEDFSSASSIIFPNHQ